MSGFGYTNIPKEMGQNERDIPENMIAIACYEIPLLCPFSRTFSVPPTANHPTTCSSRKIDNPTTPTPSIEATNPNNFYCFVYAREQQCNWQCLKGKTASSSRLVCNCVNHERNCKISGSHTHSHIHPDVNHLIVFFVFIFLCAKLDFWPDDTMRWSDAREANHLQANVLLAFLKFLAKAISFNHQLVVECSLIRLEKNEFHTKFSAVPVFRT